jgi:hypothetical protein
MRACSLELEVVDVENWRPSSRSWRRRSLADGELLWTRKVGFIYSVQTCNKNLFIQRNRDFRIWEKKEKKKSQKANFFNFPARELVLVSKAPSWAPDFRSVLRKILTGLEHSQNPVFTQIKLGYSRNMYFVVITFSSALRDSTPEHKSLARSCWDQIWFRKNFWTSTSCWG